MSALKNVWVVKEVFDGTMRLFSSKKKAVKNLESLCEEARLDKTYQSDCWLKKLATLTELHASRWNLRIWKTVKQIELRHEYELTCMEVE